MTAVLLTTTLGAVSFVLSYSGLVEVADWASVPDFLAWTVPVTIDASILVYTLAVFIFRARGESTATAWWSLIGFTTVSVAANAAHAWDASLHDWHGYAGAGIAGLAPVSVLLTTHTLAELIVARPAHRHAPDTAQGACPTAAVSRPGSVIAGVPSQAPDVGQAGTSHEPAGSHASPGRSRARGRSRPGRPNGTSHGQTSRSTDDLRAMRDSGMTIQQIMNTTRLSRSTVYRRLERDPRVPETPSEGIPAVSLQTSPEASDETRDNQAAQGELSPSTEVTHLSPSAV
ncbi:DUF2637 domain-containing protein [Antribacter sp. KLBMP9083]|uniref:DUF2637 domain-containing protein n=1 Tax=Antribacter soli TaxID=2910976 RepID=A0AA41QF82_9MICO|nr:DUF2637 domain-containing protein [Antribacter soli]MCF4122033.1 DUF2637 domain-containing protein [Antribacter soli]